MKTIWKYKIKSSLSVIEMPKDAEIINLQVQNNIPCLYAIVETDNELVKRGFGVYYTGERLVGYNPLEKFTGKYIGTYQKDELVLHVFEDNSFIEYENK